MQIENSIKQTELLLNVLMFIDPISLCPVNPGLLLNFSYLRLWDLLDQRDKLHLWHLRAVTDSSAFS